MNSNAPEYRKGLRVIKTARSEEAINRAAREGYFPLVKKVEQSDSIRSKFAVAQNELTGEIIVLGDYRSSIAYPYKWVIEYTFYYPHNFDSPFAAYLVPSDLLCGHRVFLEDLIEDRVSMSWNQGDAYRLEASEAVWNGQDFEIESEETAILLG